MARPILMPQVGQDLTHGKITAINVKLGDKVKKGDIVAEVESEKATFEVEAFETGTVVELRYAVGDLATVLQPLMLVGEPGETTVAAMPEPVITAPAVTLATAPVAAMSGAASGSSPLARRLAAEAGLDIRTLKGTGPNGAVVKADVQGQSTSAPAISSAPGALRSLQPGTGDPVVFIHGFGADLSAWRPFILHLGLTNPIFAIDLPAHGANATSEAASFEAMVAMVHAALAASGLDRLHLAGHSLGAAVAADLAGGGSLDVRSLSLISPAGLGPRINGDFIAGFLAANCEAALKAWLALLVHKPAMLPGALVRATLAAREGTGLSAAQAKLAAALFADGTQLFSIRDALERYNGPLRVIIGKEDRIIPAAYADQLPPHAALHRLPQVGHLPQLEAAALVAGLLAQTIRSAG
jgi:pimeloyl-ACP methyl ester carboxylesterase